MAGLALNGIEVEARLDGQRLADELIGDRSRSPMGAFQPSVRRRKGMWRFRTAPVTFEESLALQGLIGGRGDAWSFDADANSARGRVPTSSLGIVPGSVSGSLLNHGNYGLASGYLARAAWATPPAAEWTLLMSVHRPVTGSASAWRRWLRRSDGAQWMTVSGAPVRDDAADLRTVGLESDGTLWFQTPVFGGAAWQASTVYAAGALTVGGTFAHEVVTGGTSGASEPTWAAAYGGLTVDGGVTWRAIGGLGGAGHCGDLAWLPFKVPDSWVTEIHTEHLARAWTAPPYLRATGDLIANAPRTVMGEMEEIQTVPHWSGGVWLNNAQALTFVLREA